MWIKFGKSKYEQFCWITLRLTITITVFIELYKKSLHANLFGNWWRREKPFDQQSGKRPKSSKKLILLKENEWNTKKRDLN